MRPGDDERKEMNQRPRSGATPMESSLNKPSKESMQTLADAKFKRKEQQARDGVKAMAEYTAAGDAMRVKTEKLRALRLAKEAEDAKAAAEAKPAPAKAGKKKT